MKLKKQFRLADIYRYVALKYSDSRLNRDYTPNVMGIESFYCDSKLTLIQVNGHSYFVEEGEDGLRDIVRQINKQLVNSRTPNKQLQIV